LDAFLETFGAAVAFFPAREAALTAGAAPFGGASDIAVEDSLAPLLFDPCFGTFEYKGAIRGDPKTTHSSESTLQRGKWNMMRFTFPDRSTLATVPTVNLFFPFRCTSKRADRRSDEITTRFHSA
jgi:hypothetical protein